ncbi:hypothetical protein Taro_001967 [Colocasia esculenta]|uniref:Beta-glucosidase n=1 Tax=Colocasia esculenta TaxID=4460 RepID=A0A843TBH6_COLES|nr:hypothetical protein [Colocasia esculenta]
MEICRRRRSCRCFKYLNHHLLLLLCLSGTASIIITGAAAISRQDFPPGFIFGAGSSAYQVEGAAAEDGRKPSIWDTFTHAGKTFDKKTGDKAADQYHKYKEDVKLMHEMGLDAYRLSISWSRLIPDGRGPVNPKGLRYYNNLIDELVSYGIQPHVTLYHFDMPQTLQDEYGGLLSPNFVGDFTAYADTCFKELGDRVKYWSTFNEPNIEAVLGYDVGLFPPARCSYPFGLNCSVDGAGGDSTTEPYVSAHHILLSHASAANLYRQKYQAEQGGYIGITLLGFWYEPSPSNSPQDVAAAKRSLDFHLGWFMEPLTRGKYPGVMRRVVGSRLPSLNGSVSEQLKKSFDFIGLNHYLVLYVHDYPQSLDDDARDYVGDVSVRISELHKGPPAPMPTTPWALQRLLDYFKVEYGNPPVLIHENGYGESDGAFSLGKPEQDDLDDGDRVEYIRSYIEAALLPSIRNGSNARGYFVWSFLDCFETVLGYSARFGLYKVDFADDDRRRYPRRSAHWYSSFLGKHGAAEAVVGVGTGRTYAQ